MSELHSDVNFVHEHLKLHLEKLKTFTKRRNRRGRASLRWRGDGAQLNRLYDILYDILIKCIHRDTLRGDFRATMTGESSSCIRWAGSLSLLCALIDHLISRGLLIKTMDVNQAIEQSFRKKNGGRWASIRSTRYRLRSENGRKVRGLAAILAEIDKL